MDVDTSSALMHDNQETGKCVCCCGGVCWCVLVCVGVLLCAGVLMCAVVPVCGGVSWCVLVCAGVGWTATTRQGDSKEVMARRKWR